LEGDVANRLHKLQTIFSKPFKRGTVETMIPACFGVACYPLDGVTSELLLHHAHIAMNHTAMLFDQLWTEIVLRARLNCSW
jgi:GGDEF domain-containing protein